MLAVSPNGSNFWREIILPLKNIQQHLRLDGVIRVSDSILLSVTINQFDETDSGQAKA